MQGEVTMPNPKEPGPTNPGLASSPGLSKGSVPAISPHCRKAGKHRLLPLGSWWHLCFPTLVPLQHHLKAGAPGAEGDRLAAAPAAGLCLRALLSRHCHSCFSTWVCRESVTTPLMQHLISAHLSLPGDDRSSMASLCFDPLSQTSWAHTGS